MKKANIKAMEAPNAPKMPPILIASSTRPATALPVGSKFIKKTPNRSSTVTKSSNLSIRIVAKADEALTPSFLARRYGRNTSPGRAGNSAEAANPIMVVRNAVMK